MSNNVKRNSLYIEIGGQSIFYSLNYDKLLQKNENFNRSFSIGVSVIPKTTLCEYGVSIPVSYNFLYGKTEHKFEIGIGLTPVYTVRHTTQQFGGTVDSEGMMNYGGQYVTYVYKYLSHEKYLYFTPKIGYRYQKQEGGLFFKAELTPVFAGYFFQRRFNEEHVYDHSSHVTSSLFKNIPFSSKSVQLWAGISLGWTLKR